MLQKLLTVIVSLVSALASAVVPTGWLGGEPEAPTAEEPRVVAERLTTLGFAGQDFARVSVLWVEVDGERLREDAWGEGRLDEVKFKVGVKRAEGNALKLGPRTVALAPTDVFTIRDFSGRFAFADVGSPGATIALDGTVKNTIVTGGGGGDLTTRGPAVDTRGPDARRAEKLAYVVLDDGAPVGTLEVASGGAQKLFTSGPAGTSPGVASASTAIDARWVKIDNALVTSYVFGEGEISRIEFEPDVRLGPVLNFNGRESKFKGGDVVEVREFLGSWSVTLRPGGGMRVKLDGWASSANVLPAGAGLNSNPSLAFTYEPLNPSTKDIVLFTADARDRDGSVLLHEWTFLRKLEESAEYTPDDLLSATRTGPAVEHRFSRPGTWLVTLRAVDNEGGVSTLEQQIVVQNTAPTAAFDWYPNSPVTLESVRFYDRSTDLDGVVVSRLWEFGDGTTSVEKEPVKAWTRNGLFNVTLTVRDVHGAESVARHLVAVRNAPPDCSFALDPGDPAAFQVTTFTDRSTDREQALAGWSWKVLDLENASRPVATYEGREVRHTFLSSNLHRVSLRVTDAGGASTECSLEVDVRNTPPAASFTWYPLTPTTREFTYLNSTAYDADGRVVKWEWTIEGDPEVKTGPSIGYAFPRADAFTVTLKVTDNGGLTNTFSEEVVVANSAPIASFTWNPTSPYTGQTVRFTNTSRDLDGDAQASWEWDFGAGESPRTASGPQVSHVFAENGVHPVKLTVTDSHGNARSVIQNVIVLNRVPRGNITYSPSPAVVGDNLTFTTDAVDPDGRIVRYRWLFGDGATAEGQTVRHTFADYGRFQVKLVLTDDDDGQSEIPLTLDVRRAGPVASFVIEPPVGAVDRPSVFRDTSVARGAPIVSWKWSFGDNTASNLASPSKAFSAAKTYAVTLTVKDQDGTEDRFTTSYVVTHPPAARFTASTLSPKTGETVTLTDTSYDLDGTIASRVWTIDGVQVSSAPSLQHTFNQRGPHPVQLTVYDDLGVASHRFENVTVQNVKPLASFTVSPDPVIEGRPATLESTSVDPDGTIVASRTVWRVQNLDLRSSPNPLRLDYTFPRSGLVPVSLSVEDDSGGRGTATVTIPVHVNHDVRYEVRVRYADGTLPSVQGLSATFMNLRTNRVYALGDGVTIDASSAAAALTLPAGTWVAGDRFVVTGTTARGPFEFGFTADATDTLDVVRTIVYPKPFAPVQLVMDAGPSQGALSGFPRVVNLGPMDGVYYATGSQRVSGTVTAAWADPAAPAEDARVQIWMNRSIGYPMRLVGTVNDQSFPVLYTRADHYADENGRVVFQMPWVLDSAVQTNPPGWYTIEVLVTWPNPLGYIKPERAAANVYVDVEGLFQAVANDSVP